MGPERFARVAAAPGSAEGFSVRDKFIRGIAAAGLIAAAAALAGCGTAPRPFSIEEAIWFGKASHPERFHGYPYYREAPYAPRRRAIDDAPPFVPPPVGYRG